LVAAVAVTPARAWTDTFENFYAFTVGVNGTATAVTPEPTSVLRLGSGIAGLIGRRRLRR